MEIVHETPVFIRCFWSQHMYFLYAPFANILKWSRCAKSAVKGGKVKMAPDKQIA